MEIQTSAFRGETQYFLDSAQEDGSLLAAAWGAIRLYGDRDKVDEIVNAPRLGRRYSETRAVAIELDRYGLEIIAQLEDQSRRNALIGLGVMSLLHQINDKAAWLCDFNFTDRTTGGAETWLPRGRRARKMTAKNLRHLMSPRAIRRYAKERVSEFIHLRHAFDAMMALPWAPPTQAEIDAFNADCDWQFQTWRRRESQALTNAAGTRAAYVDWRGGQPVAVMADGTVVSARPKPRYDRSARTKIKRAAALAAGLLGATTVSAFAQGKPVEIRGEKIAFEVMLTGRLDALGHGAISVNLMALDGQRLSGLCVYHPKTPALDQLAAIALHCSAGVEQELIDIGNLYSVQAEGYEHDVIKARYGKAEEVSEAYRQLNQIPDIRDMFSTFDKQREQAKKYESSALHLYRDAVAVIVLGRYAKHAPIEDFKASMERIRNG